MKKNKTFIMLITLTVFLNLFNLSVVNAFDGNVDIGYTNYENFASNTLTTPSDLYDIHSETNQILYASVIGGTYGDELVIHIVGDDGTINADFSIDYSGDAYQMIQGIGVTEMDETYMLIHYQTVYVSSYDGLYSRVLKINMNNYAYTVYTSAFYSYRSSSADHFVYGSLASNMVYDETDNTYIWAITTIRDTASVKNAVLYIVEYDDTANTVSIGDTSGRGDYDETYLGKPYIAQLTDTSYLVYCPEDSTKDITFHNYDFSTSTLTYIGVFATSNIWEGSDKNRYMSYIDTGFESETVGNDTHHYTYLVYTNGENLGAYSPYLNIRYLRLKFNNTLTTGNLLQQDIETIGYAPYSSPTDSGNPYSIGSLSEDLETLTIWYNSYYSGGSPYMSQLGKLTLVLANFTNLSSVLSVDDDKIDYETDIYPISANHPTSRDLTSGFQVTIIPSSESILIYYGGDYITDDFDISTSYVPSDSPLYSNKNYYFVVEVENHETPYEDAITLLYVDNNLINSKLTNSAGECEYTLIFSSIGSHNVTFQVYKNPSTLVYDETEGYTVVQDTGITEEEEAEIFGETLYGLAFQLLPIGAIILIPAGIGADVAGFTGFMFGGIIGLSVVVGAGMLPIYYVYLIALVLAIGLIVVLRSGRSTKE